MVKKVKKDLAIVYPENVDIIDPSQKSAIIEKTPSEYVRERVGRGNRKVKYVETGYVIKKLNEIFNYLWSFDVLEEKVYEKAGQIIIKGKLTVHPSPTVVITKTQYGGSIIKLDKTGKVVSLADDFKAAGSDSLKKCASLLGIASDVYWGKEVEEVESIDEGLKIESKGNFEPNLLIQKILPASDTQIKKLEVLAKQLKFDVEKVKKVAVKNFKLNDFKEINSDQIETIIKSLTKAIIKNEQETKDRLAKEDLEEIIEDFDNWDGDTKL